MTVVGVSSRKTRNCRTISSYIYNSSVTMYVAAVVLTLCLLGRVEITKAEETSDVNPESKFLKIKMFT